MGEVQPSDEAQRSVPGHAVEAGSGERPHPGDIVIDPNLGIVPEPLVGSDTSTALDEDESSTTIPRPVLWAMKARRHTQWHLLPSSERHQLLRQSIGSGSDELHVIDDGRHHVMIGRLVGTVSDDVAYCLIGRLNRDHLQAIEGGSVPASAAYNVATEVVLCATATEVGVESSNVFDVSRFSDAASIPAEYLPGVALHHFAAPLEITIY